MLSGRKPIQARLIRTSCPLCPLLLSGARLSTLLPAFSYAVRAGKQIIVVTKAARSQVNKYFFAKKKEIEAKKKATAPKKTSATKKSPSASEDEDDSKQMKMF